MLYQLSYSGKRGQAPFGPPRGSAPLTPSWILLVGVKGGLPPWGVEGAEPLACPLATLFVLLDSCLDRKEGNVPRPKKISIELLSHCCFNAWFRPPSFSESFPRSPCIAKHPSRPRIGGPSTCLGHGITPGVPMRPCAPTVAPMKPGPVICTSRPFG